MVLHFGRRKRQYADSFAVRCGCANGRFLGRSTIGRFWKTVNLFSEPKSPHDADAQLPSSPAIARIRLR
jgi:hypothetical protein